MALRLVILGSTITALAVARDAAARGIRPIVVDTQDGIAFRSRWVTPRRLPGGTDGEATLAALLALGGEDSSLIATGDPWVRVVMRHRPPLDEAYRAVLHPSNNALEICLNKRLFADWCADSELPAPRSWVAGAAGRPEGLNPPFLIRPAETLHGRPIPGIPKAIEVRTEEELMYWLRKFDVAGCLALVSESLLGQRLIQYSIPFARSGGELLSFVARKLRPAPSRCAVGTCVELSPRPEVEAIGRRAAEALNYFGVGEAEVLHSEDTGRSYLIEINARPWLQYALAPSSGHDFLGLIMGASKDSAAPAKVGRRWIDLRSDLFVAFSSSEGAVRRGQLRLSEYLASLAGVNVFARFDPRDPLPAFYREDAQPTAVNRVTDKGAERV